MERPINTPTPAGPAAAYDTYQVLAPYSTHYRVVDCEAAECGAYANGWRTLVDESTTRGQAQAHYIRRQSGRAFTEARDPSGATVFTFRRGQPCFATHRQRLEREEDFYRRRGDWRQYLGRARKYERADQWVDDFATNQDNIKTQLERG